MTGVPYQFANVTTNQPGAYLDANFNYLEELISQLPSGVQITATETIAANALVNIWASAGTFAVRNASGTSGFSANGFVLFGVSSTQTAVVYPFGTIVGLTGLNPGPVYLGSTAGTLTQTVPTLGSGDYLQNVGFALSTTSVYFQPGQLNGPL